MKYAPAIAWALILIAASPPALPANVEVSAIAVRATNEEREGVYLDPSLRPLAQTLEEFPYNTFHVLMPEKRTVMAPGKDATFVINERYSLTMTFLESDENGRSRIRTRVQETIKIGEKTVLRDALDTTCTIAPHKHLLLGGLKLDEGELALVLSVSPAKATSGEPANEAVKN